MKIELDFTEEQWEVMKKFTFRSYGDECYNNFPTEGSAYSYRRLNILLDYMQGREIECEYGRMSFSGKKEDVYPMKELADKYKISRGRIMQIVELQMRRIRMADSRFTKHILNKKLRSSHQA